MKGMRGKKILSLVTAFSLAVPTGIIGNSTVSSARVVDANYEKHVVWSTSFEDGEGKEFRESQKDAGKGSSNVSDAMKSDLVGNLSSLIEGYEGTDPKSSDKETLNDLFDGNEDTKYLVDGNQFWVTVTLKEARTVDYYYMTSANDEGGRDPKTWKLYGSNDKSNWTVIDERGAESWGDNADDNRKTRKEYQVYAPGAYRYYKLDVTSNRDNSKNMTQLSELILTDRNYVAPDAGYMRTEIGTGPDRKSVV